MQPNPAARQQFWLLLAALLIAATVRIPPVARESIWLDEAFTNWVVTQPWDGAVATVRRDVTHPPLHYLLTRGAVGLLGNGPVGLRIVSLLASLALVGVTFGLARSLAGGDLWVAFGAALLVAVSDLQTFHAINARGYALWSLLIAGCAWCFLLVVTQPERRWPRIGLAATATLAMLTHYFSALYFVAFALVAVVSSRRRRALRDLILLSLPALFATAGWFAFLLPLERISEAGRLLNWISAPDPFRVLRVGLLLFGVPLVPMGTRIALGSAILLGAVAGVLLLRRPSDLPRLSREALWLLGAAIVVPAGLILLAYAVSGTSYWVARQLLPSQAFVAIAAALGIAVIARTHRGLAAFGLVGLVVLNNPGRLYGPPALRNDPFNRIAEDLKAQRQSGELAVATTSNTLWILNYYLSGADSATLLRHGPYHPDPVDWGPYPYPPLTDSVLAAQAALWVVAGWSADRRDSLVRAGWRVESNRAYPLARRPELWPADTVRLMKLVPPAVSDSDNSPRQRAGGHGGAVSP